MKKERFVIRLSLVKREKGKRNERESCDESFPPTTRGELALSSWPDLTPIPCPRHARCRIMDAYSIIGRTRLSDAPLLNEAKGQYIGDDGILRLVTASLAPSPSHLLSLSLPLCAAFSLSSR